MSNFTIFNDFLKYRDIQGLSQDKTDGTNGITSQNGELFTIQYLLCLLSSEDISDFVKKEETKRISKILGALETKPGLTIRFQGSTEVESMDNQCAQMFFSAVHGDGSLSKRILERGKIRVLGLDQNQDGPTNAKNLKWYKIAKIVNFGKEPKHCWNAPYPTLFCERGWFGRSPAFLGLNKMTSGKLYNPFLWVSVLVGQFLGCFKNTLDTDARTLPYVCWQYLRTRSLFWKLAYKLWCFILMKTYPNGMKDVYAIYFQDKDHPIIKYSKPFI